MLSFLNKKNTGTPKPLPPILVRQMADPLHWEDRKNDLMYHISHLNLSPNDTHKTLKDGLRLIVDERRAVSADETIPAATRALSETHLLSMASMMTKEIIKLQEYHPELKLAEKSSRPILRAVLTKSLTATFAAIDAATPVAKYIGAATHKFATNQWEKFKPWAGQQIDDAVTQFRSDVGEVRDEIKRSVRDTASELKYTLRGAFEAKAMAGLIIAAGVVGAGTAAVMKLKNEEAATDKSPEPAAYYTYTDIKPIQIEEPVARSTKKSFNTYSGSTNHNTNIKARRGQKLAHYNWDALLYNEEYFPVLERAVNKFMGMRGEAAFKALIQTESGGKQMDKSGKPTTSNKGATGIAQVMPDTAKEIAENCTGEPLDEYKFQFDARYNYEIGKCYFLKQRSGFGNNVLAALAYNGGDGGLNKRIKKSGVEVKNTAQSMVELIQTIGNKENRHYTLVTMYKAGFIKHEELGPDVTGAKETGRAANLPVANLG